MKLGMFFKCRGRMGLFSLLVVGATSTIRSHKHGSRSASGWLPQLLECKLRKFASTTLANRVARIVCLMISREGAYQHRPIAA